MKIHAYNELYLNDAMISLSNAFDYAINVCNISPDIFSLHFSESKFIKLFERGNPRVISGISGIELVIKIFSDNKTNYVFPEPIFYEKRSAEYWAGWALAQYQWYTGLSFRDIFARIPLTDIIEMYYLYHEMNISRFIEAMNSKFDQADVITKLRMFRENIGLSQSQLANESGVSLRSIQLYEQRVNDIDKAQVQTLYKLSLVLHCSIEDLLENPLKCE